MFYTAEGFSFSLGKKTKNEFKEASISLQKGTEFRVYEVKIPFTYAITVETNNSNITKLQTMEFYGNPISNLNEIIKQIESNQYKVIKVEEATRALTDLCPQCHKHGIPKIEKKDATDRRTKSQKYAETKQVPKRPDEYWLTYDHKSKPKKCRIRQFESTPEPAYKINKRKNIEIEKYFFPYIIGYMSRRSSKFAD